MGLYGDRPISRPEDDALGLTSFANALATSLLEMSPNDGLVVSIEAPWGAGKSSAIALTSRAIKVRVLTALGANADELHKLNSNELEAKWDAAKARKTHVIRFNPWNFSGQENLVRAFFKELAAQIDAEPDGPIRKAANLISDYLPSAFTIAGAGGALAMGAIPAATAAAASTRAVGEAAARALKSETSLETARQNLASALRSSDCRIIVIIDDLDRLSPSEMRAMLSLVKSLGDLPNVLYVLAFDANVVRQALQDSAEKLDPDFLEKIVQVSLKLPPPWRSELRAMFFSRLNEIMGEAEPPDRERWRRMFMEAIDPYLETPRDVARLVNTIQVVWPNLVGDVDIADIIALSTLQLFEPDIYSLIRSNIETLTGANYRYESAKERGARLEPKAAKNIKAARAAMALMFPSLAEAWGSFMRDGTYYITQREHRRISTKEFYRNYFSFGRTVSQLSRAEIDFVVNSDDVRLAISQMIEKLILEAKDNSARIPALLDQLTATFYESREMAPDFLRGLLDKSDVLIKRKDEIWELFPVTNQDRIAGLIAGGLNKLDRVGRLAILDVLKNYNSGLSARAEVIEREARRHGLFGGDKKHESEWLYTEEEITEASASIRDEIATACETGTIWGAPKPTALIWAWKRLGGESRLAAWTRQVLSDDDAIIQIASEAPHDSHRTGGRDGQRVVRIFNRDSWNQLFDVDELYERLAAIASTNERADAALKGLREAEEAARRD